MTDAEKVEYYKLQLEMMGQELGDLRSLTVGEAPNASFVVSYRELLAEAKPLRALKTRIETFLTACDEAEAEARMLIEAEPDCDDSPEDARIYVGGSRVYISSIRKILNAVLDKDVTLG